jgi:hypothetical protein
MKITKSKLKKIIKEELANERLAGGEKLTTGEFSTTMRKQAAQTQQGLSDEERAMLIGVTDKLKQAATKGNLGQLGMVTTLLKRLDAELTKLLEK